ncbi:MAG: sigma-70 family RNA polymerase sigma factor [Bacteroidales bacterium]|nr:sigma-70 family RNA polymerase sigma factor [Bacteroidales bacterium]
MSKNQKMEEKELIKRLLRKERAAQKYLFEKYSALFYGICLRYSYSNDEADDIMQEGFLKIMYNVKKYSGKGSFEGWMKRIIINNAINYYHKNYKYRHHFDVDEIRETKTEDNLLQESDFTYKELLTVIKELPPGYKQIFNLYAIEGFKHKEIAEMLKISENTSKSQYHRAKKILQDKLEKILEQRKKALKNAQNSNN